MDKLMSLAEVAQVANVSEATMRWLRHQGEDPKSGKIGRKIMYRESDVITWINAKFDAS